MSVGSVHILMYCRLSGEITMTKASLKQSKADTIAPSVVEVTLSQAEVIKLAQSIATNYVLAKSAVQANAEACKKLFLAGVKLGKRKAAKGKESCKVTAAFLEARYPGGLNTKGEKVADETLANCATFFKRAVETGEPYTENAPKKKGAGNVIMISIKKSITGAEAAGALMTGFNKMKEANEQLAVLASYLIDAIGKAGFEPAEVAADDAE
jgi:hypothetical protein